MKKTIFALLFLASCLMYINCTKSSDDITKEVTGEYIGQYSNNDVGDINNYEIVITKVNDSRIRIEPKNGNEFESWETDIQKINISNITAPTGQIDPTIGFGLGDSVEVSFHRADEGDQFTGGLK